MTSSCCDITWYRNLKTTRKLKWLLWTINIWQFVLFKRSFDWKSCIKCAPVGPSRTKKLNKKEPTETGKLCMIRSKNHTVGAQITGVSIVCAVVCSGADQRKHQSFALLAFVKGIHRPSVNSPHKGPVTRKNVFIWWRHHVTSMSKWITRISLTTDDMGATKQNRVYDDIKWQHFPGYWLFVRGIHLSSVNSPHKGQWRGALMFSLICVWINGWVNNCEAGDLRGHRAHYDVTVVFFFMDTLFILSLS